VSSLPEIVQITHTRITFNRGQTTGVVTLESLPDGKIGEVTVIIAPERAGLYRPATFNVLVQGQLSANFESAKCVGVGIPENILISTFPVPPEDIQVNITSRQGSIVETNVFVPLGKGQVLVQFNASTIGPASITFTTQLYGKRTLNFNVLGSFFTNGPDSIVSDAPALFNVTVVPDGRPNVFVSGKNAVVTPASFTLGEDGSLVEVIAETSGIATVRYNANGYCPREDTLIVNPAPFCASGFVVNLAGTACVPCPGNSDSFRLADDCYGQGTCGYSKCVPTAGVCFCNFPYFGPICQYNSIEDADFISLATLNRSPFRLSLDSIKNTAGPIKFNAPGDLITEDLQPGRAILAGYYESHPYPGQINPSQAPPPRAIFSGIGWTWENTCFENTLIRDFNRAPVSVRIAIDPEAFSAAQFFQVELFVYNKTSLSWEDSVQSCFARGFNTSVAVDFVSMTLTTSFCSSGQYAVYVVPNSPPVSNTGITFLPNPPNSILSGTTPGTGRTGWQPAPPLPRPVEEERFDPSPPKKNPEESESSASSLVASVAVLVAALCMMF
jgi:hypothetical protein